ncbi:MAG TPA: hypothetical protein VF786_13330, partial [Terriglobales bacterium]
DYRENIRRRNVRLAVNPEGPATGTITVQYGGQDSLIHRIDSLETDAAGRTKSLEDEIKGWLPANAEVKLVSSPAWEDYEHPLEATFQVKCNILTSAGHRVLVPAHLLEFTQQPRFTHATRVNKVYFAYPYGEIDETRIRLPETMRVESVPDPVQNKLDYAAYVTDYAKASHEFVAGRQLMVGLGIFEVNEYKQLKSFYDNAHTVDQSQAVVQGASHASGN